MLKEPAYQKVWEPDKFKTQVGRWESVGVGGVLMQG